MKKTIILVAFLLLLTSCDKIELENMKTIEEVKKTMQSILSQEITKEGNKLIASLISENGGEEGLLEKVISYIAKPENSSSNGDIALSAKDAQAKFDNYVKRGKGGSGGARRSFGGRGGNRGGGRSFGGSRSGGGARSKGGSSTKGFRKPREEKNYN